MEEWPKPVLRTLAHRPRQVLQGESPGLFIGVRCRCTVHSPLPNGEERNVLLTLNQVWKGPFEELDVCTLGTGEDNDLVSDTHLRNLKQAVKT